jgi:hypothetical protein
MWKGQECIGNPHDHISKDAAIVARDETQGGSQQRSEKGHDHGPVKGYPRAIDHAAHDVSAVIIGSEGIYPVGGFQPVENAHVVDFLRVGSQIGGEEGDNDHNGDHPYAAQGHGRFLYGIKRETERLKAFCTHIYL